MSAHMAGGLQPLRHGVVHHDPQWYCGHPRQGICGYFGGGELVVGHNHAACAYQQESDIAHDLGGYHSRSVVLLQRSLDGGVTWPGAGDVVVYDETATTERKRAFLYPGPVARADYDMTSPDALFFFGRTYLPEDRGRVPVCFALRSPDRGRSWETTPTIIRHPGGEHLWVHKDCHPVVCMPDGRTLLAAMSHTSPAGPAIYHSRDNGLSWQCLSQVISPPSGSGRFTYAGLLLLPDGELQCYSLHIQPDDETVAGPRNAICLFRSTDGGETWSVPAPIVGARDACWRNPAPTGRPYRSPWPMLLRDGRILVIFGRRRMPMGTGAVLSSDGGRTWGAELVIRDDASCDDLGYPVGCQLEDGRVFIAYYYTLADGNAFGGTRFIASSHFLA